ncbi:5578_t:CDS:2, partial [Racocetra fulgida]
MAVAMRSAGVRKGDRICAYISNCPEAVIAMLASTSIGAIWSSASPDFGVSGVLDRFSQIRPKILFSTNSVVYNDKPINILPKLKHVAESLEKEGLEKVIVVPFNEFNNYDLSSISLATSWNDFLNNYSVAGSSSDEIDFEQLPFDHPLYILFSSGTTGKPKCMVHRAGGVLIQHKKEHILHGNMSKNDYIQNLQDLNYKPIEQCNLQSIRIILSTGSPLKSEGFDYVYNSIKKDVLLGGTDLCSLFCGLNVTLPVYRGEIQANCLGMKIEAWDGESGVVMLGRSDGTLNPGGVRFGSAEIYNIVESFSEVQDSLVVGQKIGEDERVVLFLKMCDGMKFSDELVTRIKAKIRKDLSPRHVPSFVLPIRDIP